MRPFLVAVAFVMAGCDLTGNSDLGKLRAEVTRQLEAGWVCSPVAKDEASGHYFFLIERKPQSGFSILVEQWEFLTQKEWEERQARGKALFEEAARDPANFTPEKARELSKLMRVPDGTYRGIGVGFRIQEPEKTYPGWEKDLSEAGRAGMAVEKLLKLYKHGEDGRVSAPNRGSKS